MRVQLLSVPDCPNVGRARDLLRSCMAELGLPVEVDETHGEYPSPSILVNGTDVMGDPGYRGASCRLDVPTRAAVLGALGAR
jgi:hypothetical protein